MNFAAIAQTRIGRHLISWRQDTDWRDRVINIGHLLSGNFLSSLVALVGVAIAARALGPAAYGIMTLIVSYTRLIERIMRFHSWQPLFKYAAELNKAADREVRKSDVEGKSSAVRVNLG